MSTLLISHLVLAFTIPMDTLHLLLQAVSRVAVRQRWLDTIDDDGGAGPSYAASQLATALLSRSGPRGAHVAIHLLGGMAAGVTEEKSGSDPWYRVVRNGSASALARAYVRGEWRTVAYFLHALPALKPAGTLFKEDKRDSRAKLTEWVALQQHTEAAAAALDGASTRCGSRGGAPATAHLRRRSYASVAAGVSLQIAALVGIALCLHMPPCDICAGTTVREGTRAILECVDPQGQRVTDAASNAACRLSLPLLSARGVY